MNNVGKLRNEHARDIICFLWRGYLVDDAGGGQYTYRYKCDNEKEHALQNVSSLQDLESGDQDLYTLWQKTEMLIQLTTEKGLEKSVDELPLLHMVIKLHLPKVVVWLALRLFLSKVKDKDKMGRLPLHWAAEYNNIDTEKGFCVECNGKLSELKTKRIVELVLHAFPKGAKYPDNEGSLPLALLLDLEHRSWTLNNWTERCVMALMKQAPEALMQRNVKNFMLPFMAAASIHDKNTVKAKNKFEEKEMLQRKFELTYAILRENPTVVASGIYETHREKYLNEKIGVLEEEKRKLQEDLTRLKSSQGNAHKKQKYT